MPSCANEQGGYMKGLELSRKFYLEYGVSMLHEKIPELEGLVAVGLAGSGSECFGYDDELSHDHDFEPGFCIFLPDESVVDRKAEFALERAYTKLPMEFMGYKRSILKPVGGNRHGVIRMGEFFKSRTGNEKGELSLRDWFFLPEQSLLEATGGEVFRDDLGEFSTIRESLRYMPEDVRLKKLAGNLLIMGQAGQYNYSRCASRGESGAAQLAAAEFVKSAMNVIFLLNRRYIPYYKWSFRALSELPMLSELGASLEYLISSKNTETEVIKKTCEIEKICAEVISELVRQGLSDFDGAQAEAHAYAVNRKIGDGNIRNLHILYAI